MVVHPQLLQSDRYWHQSVATLALLAAVLWIGSLDRHDTTAMAVSTDSDVAATASVVDPAAHALRPKIVIVKDRALMMRLYAGIDKE